MPLVTLQVLSIIIAACQVTGTAGSQYSQYAISYEKASGAQEACQKQLITCFREKRKKADKDDRAITDCLLER